MAATEHSAVSSCMECIGLGKEHVPSFGNAGSDLMVIGASPGKKEVELGEPFIGPSGDLVSLLLSEVLLDRSEVYIANTLKCHPPGNRPGLPKELETCWNMWLKQEIEFVSPKVVLLCGRDAWQSVIGRFPKAAEKLPWGHGNQYTRTVKGKRRSYLVSYHPAWFLRRNDYSEFLGLGTKLTKLLEEE